MSDRMIVARRLRRGARAAAVLALMVAPAAAFSSGAFAQALAQNTERGGGVAASPARAPSKPPAIPAIGGTVYPPGRGAPTVGGPVPRAGVIGGTGTKKRF